MKIFLVSSVLFIFFLSCKEKSRSNIKNHQKNIIDTSDLSFYNPFNITAPLSKTYIISYINASCPSCINELNEWAVFQKEIKLKNNSDSIFFMPILFSKDDFKFIQHLFSSKKIEAMPFYFMLDDKNKFIDKNNFLKNNPNFHNTVIVNAENNIMSGGNPIHSKSLQQTFLKFLQNKVATLK